MTQLAPSTVLAIMQARVQAAARGRPVKLLAVSKMQSAAAVAALAAQGQRSFGENYAREAVPKIQALAQHGLEWHFIGKVQANKCELVAKHFDWIETVDREKVIPLLDEARSDALPPLQVLVQVNLEDETGKGGAKVAEAARLCAAIAERPRLALRGIMAIPVPHDDFAKRKAAFAALFSLFSRLKEEFPCMDTLSMGMSEDFELAIEQGATEVRVGQALFGARPEKAAPGAE